MQKLIISQSWRLEVHNQDVGRATHSLWRLWGRIHPRRLSWLQGWPAIFGIPIFQWPLCNLVSYVECIANIIQYVSNSRTKSLCCNYLLILMMCPQKVLNEEEMHKKMLCKSFSFSIKSLRSCLKIALMGYRRGEQQSYTCCCVQHYF